MNHSFLTKSVFKSNHGITIWCNISFSKVGHESITSNCNTMVALEDENNVSPNNNSDKNEFLPFEDLAFVLYVEWIE